MKSDIRVSILAPVCLDGAGVYSAVNGLTKALTQSQKIKIDIFSGVKSTNVNFQFDWKGSNVKILKAYGPGNFLWTPGMKTSILQSNPDVIHLHGLWMFQSYTLSKIKKIPKIISIHGMLDEWAMQNSSLKKKIALNLYEMNNLKSAHCLHALNKKEFDAIRRLGLKNPVAIIPNGVDFYDIGFNSCKPFWSDIVPKDSKVLLFLGRIHKKKGVESLLVSWKEFIKKLNKSDIESKWSLVIAGSGEEEYVGNVKKMQSSLGIEDTSFFVGPVSGKDKELTFFNSDAFVLPSYSEGLPMSVLEACSFKLPVLLTKECNLNDIIEYKSGIEIVPGDFSDSLVELASKSNSELVQMGVNGYDIVKRKYEWTKVSGSYYDVYQWLLGKRRRPESVIID